MPGLVVFNRRWSVGSDDLVVPGVFLFVLHTVWLIVLASILGLFDFGELTQCIVDLHEHMLGYIVILSGCIIVEACISWVSMRGSILYTEPRASMEYLLYVRLGFMFVELAWLIVGVVWVSNHYTTCPAGMAKEAVLGVIVCNWLVLFSVLITIWCTFDAAGHSWVKMKRYQRNLRDSRTKYNYRRSGSTNRDWRHRKVVRAYQESWNSRCRMLFCCMGKSDRNSNSFAEIAKLLSEFFRDLDVVPSDVVAGLVLLRKFQKMERQAIVAQRKNDTYEFLSGIPITPSSRFLALNNADVLEEFKNVIHYMQYAISAYGWPMYMKVNSGTGICRLFPHLRCCCLPCCTRRKVERVRIVEDNCCRCNYAALRKLCTLKDVDMVYVTYHVEVNETPFFVACDHEKKKIVVSIRGTLSLQDVITDLNAEGEQLPMDYPREDWLGHKGMVQAAEYIRTKLKDEEILLQAFNFDCERGTDTYDLVLVGHSLGAGTAAILAILLKQEFPGLHCYAYSPPGGLLSMPAVEYTKSFITSVVVGKDVVPRIGLHQMESLRSDLINAIKRSTDPKWKVIIHSIICCGSENNNDEVDLESHTSMRNVRLHPIDSSIALTTHQPLYPPGKIIHIVRHHPSKDKRVFNKSEPVYQAVWADNMDFDEVLISPVMIQDHMPDKVLQALQKVLSNVGPAKPQRIFTEQPERNQLLPDSADSSPLDRTPPHKLCLETSFTDLNPAETSNRSSTYSEAGPDPLNTSLSWEYPNALEDSRTIRNKVTNGTFPPTIGMPARKVDLINDDWMGLAPLASPETLSDISSVGSRGSHLRLSTAGGITKMEPITQSPGGSKVFYASDEKRNSSSSSSNDSSTDATLTTIQAVVEPEPDENIIDLESDPEDVNKYEQGQLRFYLGSGEEDRTSSQPVSPRELKRVTFQISADVEEEEEEEDSEGKCTPVIPPEFKDETSGAPLQEMANGLQLADFESSYPAFFSQPEYGNQLLCHPHYGYPSHSPFQSPTLDEPLHIYQANLANTMHRLTPSRTSSPAKRAPSDLPQVIICQPGKEQQDSSCLSPDNPVKMFFQLGQFTEESSV